MIEYIGWQCPICKKVYAPGILECDCAVGKTESAGCDHVFDTVRAGCDDYEFKCIKCGFTKQFTSKDDKFLKSTSSPNQILNEVKA